MIRPDRHQPRIMSYSSPSWSSFEFLRVAAISCEHHNSICRDHDRSGRGQPVQRTAVCPDRSSIPRHPWIHPVIVNIAVKDIQPFSRSREPEVIGPIGAFVQARHYDNVPTGTLDPALKSNNAIPIVYVKHMEA